MNVSSVLQKAFGRSLLQVQKHSPLILTTVGVVGVVTAGVIAAKNTLKLEDRVDEGQDRLVYTRQRIADGELSESALTRTYIRNAVEVGKLYATPVTLGAASLICIISAHGILSKRNVALAAAYKGIETTLGAYRDRVREEYGDEVDSDFYHGVRTEEVVDEKTGKKRLVKVQGPVTSDYIFSFGPENENWSGFADHNLFYVEMHQKYLNDLLQTRGHVFLNEALDRLGIPRTQAGSVTGWVSKKHGGEGDDFISFGIDDRQEDLGYITLEFNVDGTMFDKI